LTKINDYKRITIEDTDGSAKCAEFPERKSRRKSAQSDTSWAISASNFCRIGVREGFCLLNSSRYSAVEGAAGSSAMSVGICADGPYRQQLQQQGIWGAIMYSAARFVRSYDGFYTVCAWSIPEISGWTSMQYCFWKTARRAEGHI